MQIKYSKEFKKNYKKRVAVSLHVKKRFQERVELFSKNSRDPVLHDHQLKGAYKELRAFSITGDMRVVYRIEKNTMVFLDIGTHNQVY